jgi:V/A-type H+-transporting ATPase subunit A
MTGIFLKKGDYAPALEDNKLWNFKPLAHPGDLVTAGSWLGEVQKTGCLTNIMVPLK